jgi:hypothetical protein
MNLKQYDIIVALTAIPAFLALLGYAVSYLQNDTLLNSRNGMILIINPFNL